MEVNISLTSPTVADLRTAIKSIEAAFSGEHPRIQMVFATKNGNDLSINAYLGPESVAEKTTQPYSNYR